MSNPKVYFILGKYLGCNYVRGLLPMWFNGWNGNIIGMKGDIKPMEQVRNEIMNSEIIVFHRPEVVEFHELAKTLKQMGKKIVFDNDDTYFMGDGHPFESRDSMGILSDVSKQNDLIHNFITNSDLVTTTTEWLAKEYGEFNDNVLVLPNCVNPKDWSEPLRNDGDKVRIGLVGSVAYSMDFELIKDAIRELDKMDNVQLVMFGLHSQKLRNENPLVTETFKKEYEFFDSLDNLEHVPWSPMIDYMDTLNDLKLDIMLIPRKDCYFDKSKSNIKFLEAAMCEIPVIASSFEDGNSPYDKDLNGENGILVKNGEDWMPIIMDLTNNKDKRRAIGKKAHEYVLQHYDINSHYMKWRDAFSKILIETK